MDEGIEKGQSDNLPVIDGFMVADYLSENSDFVAAEMRGVKMRRVAVLYTTLGCPRESENAKAVYKSGEILDQSMPITIDNIKRKLKESGIFDWQDKSLSEREKKEMSKLFDAVEIMTTSRARQPSNVQNIFTSLRLVERVVKKQLKEGQLSESLAAKFNWDKIITRNKREKPSYYLDKQTNMRKFNIE